MKKHLLLAGAAVLVATAAFADDKKGETPKEVKDVKCAVMSSHKVNIAEATGKKLYADHKGRRYFFCCAACPAEFKKHPEKYAKADSIAVPKAEKK